MRLVALISGGKDSCFNMMQCVAAGHEIVALANLSPHGGKEIDSYMYQSVAHEVVEFIAESMHLPLFRIETKGKSYQREKIYHPTYDDEVEDLFLLLSSIKKKICFDGVAVGAVLSDYQRLRVENVCERLNLLSFAYLWRRNQEELLREMIACQVNAIIVKVATLGLEPSKHLGQSLESIETHLLRMHNKFGLNVCGEGGEYETLTLDCPLFRSKIIIEESEIVMHSDDPIAPVGYLKFNKLRLELKLPILDLHGRLLGLPLKDPDGYVTDHGEDALDELTEKDKSNILTPSVEKIDIVTEDKIQRNVNSTSSSSGWVTIGSIVGNSTDPYEAIGVAMTKLQNELSKYGQMLSDVCSISMFISDMSQYSQLNKIYCEKMNHVNPPSRACVQAPLPKNCPVILEAIAWSSNNVTAANPDVPTERCTMHVQSISHWAPANIGPYSQAVKVGNFVHLAGQIGLIPGTMNIIKGGIKSECRLSLRHIERLLKAMDPNMNIRDVVQGICYLTKIENIETARILWEETTNNSIMDYVVVTDLPRNALIEWHVWGHIHNNQFEYEETGKCVDEWSISVVRRWNYENNTATIVCHLDPTENVLNNCSNQTKSYCNSISLDIFKETLSYSLYKLKQGHKSNLSSLCLLKIFYSTSKDVDFELLIRVLEEMINDAPVTYTVVPVDAINSSHTVLSICGIRMQ